MKILGIDPGYEKCGVAVVEKINGKDQFGIQTYLGEVGERERRKLNSNVLEIYSSLLLAQRDSNNINWASAISLSSIITPIGFFPSEKRATLLP